MTQIHADLEHCSIARMKEMISVIRTEIIRREKDRVENKLTGETIVHATMLVHNNQKIDAIKLIRRKGQCDLITAKHYVEGLVT